MNQVSSWRIVFWGITPCSPFRSQTEVSEEHVASIFRSPPLHAGFLLGFIFDPEDGEDMFLLPWIWKRRVPPKLLHLLISICLTLVIILWPWRWKWHVLPKHRLTSLGLQGGISLKTELFITTLWEPRLLRSTILYITVSLEHKWMSNLFDWFVSRQHCEVRVWQMKATTRSDRLLVSRLATEQNRLMNDKRQSTATSSCASSISYCRSGAGY
jgi:hypothetical protein